jgi:hypothetical protein
MNSFKRGISNQDFITALKEEYNTGGWWQGIVDDKELFIAIRNEYINVYYKGNSLLKLSFVNGELLAETHYKYLIRPNVKPFLIKTSANMAFIPNGTKGVLDNYLIHNLSEIKSIKTASASYSGTEKEGIQKIILSNDNIVDLEIALTQEAEEDEMNPEQGRKSSAKRIDFAALQKKDSYYELIFFEAKDFSNKDLRAKGSAVPEVIQQINNYEKLLNQYQEDIINSYKLVCSNLCEILPKNLHKKLIVDIAEGASMKVNIEPRLVVFGFDEDQKEGSIWSPHKHKLVKSLGEKFLAKGDPTDFRNGIAKSKK